MNGYLHLCHITSIVAFILAFAVFHNYIFSSSFLCTVLGVNKVQLLHSQAPDQTIYSTTTRPPALNPAVTSFSLEKAAGVLALHQRTPTRGLDHTEELQRTKAHSEPNLVRSSWSAHGGEHRPSYPPSSGRDPRRLSPSHRSWSKGLPGQSSVHAANTGGIYQRTLMQVRTNLSTYTMVRSLSFSLYPGGSFPLELRGINDDPEKALIYSRGTSEMDLSRSSPSTMASASPKASKNTSTSSTFRHALTGGLR